MSLIPDAYHCPRCLGYDMTGMPATMRERAGSLMCRCHLTPEERADLEPKELPNGRFMVAA